MHLTPVTSTWKETHLAPFDELMLSWNGPRPSKGTYLFYVSLKTNGWSPWLLYASWGSEGQSSFLSTTPLAPVRCYQDTVQVLGGNKATGFQIKIVSEGGAAVDQLRELHVYCNGDRTQESTLSDSEPISIPVNGLSQMAIDHIRRKGFCSPTSTAAVVRYLLHTNAIDPISFAEHCWDSGFDIFGNWVFSVAQAAVELGPEWSCWVERARGFDSLYERLQQGTPVVVSIQGPLSGGAQPYQNGHLVVVRGFDPVQQKILCMDPAFLSDEETLVSYDLADFLQAWNRRDRLAYVFIKK